MCALQYLRNLRTHTSELHLVTKYLRLSKFMSHMKTLLLRLNYESKVLRQLSRFF